MKIGIVGTGNMGRVLGLTLAERGHQVFFGARNIEKARQAAQLGTSNTFSGDNQQAAEFGDVIYYNPRDVSPANVLSNSAALNRKVVVASHNSSVPLDFSFVPIIKSRAEILQAQIPEAHVVTPSIRSPRKSSSTPTEAWTNSTSPVLSLAIKWRHARPLRNL